MSTSTSHHAAEAAKAEHRLRLIAVTVTVALGAFLIYALVVSYMQRAPSSFDASLPNPMGGPARTAPGTADGELTLAGLAIADTAVAMGEVGLGITYVPDWTVTNPTDTDVPLVVGQPQVLEGCCPGPVYADGALTQPGQTLTVPAGGTVLLQFPLQMHPGMDGPHHLAVPLSAGGTTGALHVTGDFTANA